MFCPFYVCAFVHLQVQLVSPSLTMYFFFSYFGILYQNDETCGLGL